MDSALKLSEIELNSHAGLDRPLRRWAGLPAASSVVVIRGYAVALVLITILSDNSGVLPDADGAGVFGWLFALLPIGASIRLGRRPPHLPPHARPTWTAAGALIAVAIPYGVATIDNIAWRYPSFDSGQVSYYDRSEVHASDRVRAADHRRSRLQSRRQPGSGRGPTWLRANLAADAGMEGLRTYGRPDRGRAAGPQPEPGPGSQPRRQPAPQRRSERSAASLPHCFKALPVGHPVRAGGRTCHDGYNLFPA